MNIWGERFAEVDEFTSYCRDLNIETEPARVRALRKDWGHVPRCQGCVSG